ncbi:hypothetical protein [Acidovorax sp.]|uniref:hypothetical protein n=1 Tax=Acidovorax sp. TaxID=1872122 RepID=UPI0026171126|nr:hypothetical protein [Acidovorax sp.]
MNACRFSAIPGEPAARNDSQHTMKKYQPTCALWRGDPPGFDRSQLPEVDQKITAFFRHHLLP